MKKLVLIAALLFASYGVFADEYDDFARAVEKNAGPSAKVHIYKKEGVLVANYKLDLDLSKLPPERRDMIFQSVPELKNKIIEAFRNSADAEFMRNKKLTSIVNYITLDREIITVVITPIDL